MAAVTKSASVILGVTHTCGPGEGEVFDDGCAALDGATNATRDANHGAAPVPDARNAVKRSLDARAVVVTEGADAVDHVLDVLGHDRLVTQEHVTVEESRFRQSAKIKDDLDQSFGRPICVEGLGDGLRQYFQERL